MKLELGHKRNRLVPFVCWWPAHDKQTIAVSCAIVPLLLLLTRCSLCPFNNGRISIQRSMPCFEPQARLWFNVFSRYHWNKDVPRCLFKDVVFNSDLTDKRKREADTPRVCLFIFSLSLCHFMMDTIENQRAWTLDITFTGFVHITSDVLGMWGDHRQAPIRLVKMRIVKKMKEYGDTTF